MNEHTSINGITYIKVSQGQTAIIDTADWEAVKDLHWHADKQGHRILVKTNVYKEDGTRTTAQLHRVIMNPPDDMQVDHLDHNPLNNTRQNLRIVTALENNTNVSRRKSNTTGYKGVSQTQWNGFVVRLSSDYKEYHIGTFKDKTFAALVYDLASLYHRRKDLAPKESLNFPENYSRYMAILSTANEQNNWKEHHDKLTRDLMELLP